MNALAVCKFYIKTPHAKEYCFSVNKLTEYYIFFLGEQIQYSS